MGPYQPTVFVLLSMFLMLKHPDRMKHDLKSRNLETRTENIWVWSVCSFSRAHKKTVFSRRNRVSSRQSRLERAVQDCKSTCHEI